MTKNELKQRFNKTCYNAGFKAGQDDIRVNNLPIVPNAYITVEGKVEDIIDFTKDATEPAKSPSKDDTKLEIGCFSKAREIDQAKLDERNRIITLIKTRIDEYEKLINKEIIIQKEAEHLLNYDIDEDRQFLDQHVLKSKTMATHKKMWLLKKIYAVEELQQLIKQLEGL